MATTVFNRQIADAPWTIIQPAQDESPTTLALPESGGIFSLPLWLARKQEIISRYKRIGLWLTKVEEIEAVADDLHYFRVIAIDFPDFAHGRVHAAARSLRERYGYQGEIRAISSIEKTEQKFDTPFQPVPLIALDCKLGTEIARKVQTVENRLAEIARSRSPAVSSSGATARDLVLADIVVHSGLPLAIHAGAGGSDLLADWSDKEIWAYIHLHRVPYCAPPAASRPPADGNKAKLRLVQSCMARQ